MFNIIWFPEFIRKMQSKNKVINVKFRHFHFFIYLICHHKFYCFNRKVLTKSKNWELYWNLFSIGFLLSFSSWNVKLCDYLAGRCACCSMYGNVFRQNQYLALISYLQSTSVPLICIQKLSHVALFRLRCIWSCSSISTLRANLWKIVV